MISFLKMGNFLRMILQEIYVVRTPSLVVDFLGWQRQKRQSYLELIRCLDVVVEPGGPRKHRCEVRWSLFVGWVIHAHGSVENGFVFIFEFLNL